MPNDLDIAITGRGLVGSAGLDVVTACAAFRAGLNRASVLDHYSAGGEQLERAPLRAHAAPFITHGFDGPARLTQLLAAGLQDLQQRHPELLRDPARTSLILALADPGRQLRGAPAVVDETARAELLELAEQYEVYPPAQVAAELATRVQSALGLELPGRPSSVSAGHASTAHACLQAVERLRRNEIDRAIIASVDSLLDTETLDWLQLLGRLRTEDRPAGVVPGEACAVLVLERGREVRQRKTPVFAELHAVELADEPKNILAGQASPGRVLAELIDNQHRKRGQDDAPWLIADHNGEQARANEWGHCLFHLKPRAASYDQRREWFPATGFGDTGAASGGIGTCLALAAWERGYAPSDQALVCSSADGPERAVMTLRAARP
ncbi:MAG: beta-ketoacyl synthase N-terminal-like domain-containing protein [Polyangiales bacterium]